MNSLIENWQQRDHSEKIILIIVGVFLLLSLLYLLIFKPIAEWRIQLNKQQSANEKTLLEVNRLVSRYQQRLSSDESSVTGLASIIDDSLQKNNLTMRGFQPGKNDDARLRLSNVPYESLMQWLYAMEYEEKLTVEELTMSQAKTPGLLMVSVTISQ